MSQTLAYLIKVYYEDYKKARPTTKITADYFKDLKKHIQKLQVRSFPKNVNRWLKQFT